jgi:hypothetical protein
LIRSCCRKKPHLHPLFTTRRHYKGTKTSRSTNLGFRTITYGRCCTNLSSSIINNYLRILFNVSYQVVIELASQYRTIVLRAAARGPRGRVNVGYPLHSQKWAAVGHQPSRNGVAAATRCVGAQSRAFHAIGMSHDAGGRAPRPPQRRTGPWGKTSAASCGIVRTRRRSRRIGRVVRRMRDSLRLNGRVPRRRGTVGLRRSTGCQLEPRLAARDVPNCRRARAPSCRRAASRRSGRSRYGRRSRPRRIPRKRR